MIEPDEADRRKIELNDELENEIGYAEGKATATHRLSLVLMGLALCCSVAAGVLGIFTHVPSQIVGGVAILPPLIAYIAVNLKLEPRSNWHYKKSHALREVRSRLMFQLPAQPTVEHIAAISVERDRVNGTMLEEWQRTLTLNWSGMMERQGSTAHSNKPMER